MFDSAIVKIEVPYALMLPANPLLDDQGQPGPANDFYALVTFLNDHVPNWIEGVNQKTYRGTWDLQTYTWVAEVSLGMITIPLGLMIISQGGEISSLPLWAKINLDDLVPGKEVTWQQFFEETNNFEPLQIGQDFYVSTAAIGNGDYLKFSQAVGAFGFENLVTQPQFKALQAQALLEQDAPEDEIEGEVIGEGGFPAIEDTP